MSESVEELEDQLREGFQAMLDFIDFYDEVLALRNIPDES